MNKIEIYKEAFNLSQSGNSILLFAFESTETVVYEFLISEYTNTPFELLRSDPHLAKQKKEQFLNSINLQGNMKIISKVTLNQSEIKGLIEEVNKSHQLTHIIFDKEMDTDFLFHLESRYSVKIISSTLSI